MTHFYLTLPSNSSQQFFPNNTLTEFTTKLPSTIELTNEWEVGLAEIMFPRSWYTIPEEGVIILVDYGVCNPERRTRMAERAARGEDIPVKEYNTLVEIKLRGGFYKTMEDLQQELKLSIRAAFVAAGIVTTVSPPTLYYNSVTKRIHINVPAGISLTFPSLLESILGLTPEQNYICNRTGENLSVIGNLLCSLETGVQALYVYCDLLQYTHVGDIKAPLLRVVASGGEAGDVITRYYERPRYVPLQKKSFDTVQLVIRDDLGEKILFASGKVLVTLHFRRVHNQYLV